MSLSYNILSRLVAVKITPESKLDDLNFPGCSGALVSSLHPFLQLHFLSTDFDKEYDSIVFSVRNHPAIVLFTLFFSV
jgi:hypothetical protein